MTDNNRLLYLDNLRALMIVLMVIGHAVHPYKLDGGLLTANPDPSNWAFYNVISELGMTFRMPLLFLLSGYFLIHALNFKTPYDVIIDRSRRLGIPFIIGMMTVTPLVVLIKDLFGVHRTIHHLHDTLPYLVKMFWQAELTQHLWFLSLLLIMNLVTIATFHYRNSLNLIYRVCIHHPGIILISASIACMIYTTSIHYCFGKFHFFNIPPFLSLFAMPALCNQFAYLAGILIYTSDALSFIPSRINARWNLIPIVIYLMHNVVWHINYYEGLEHSLLGSVIYGVSQGVSNVTMIAFFLVFAKSHMNRKLLLLCQIREHSFAIFWVHFPIIHLLHAILRHQTFHHSIKFFMVSSITLILSYLISKMLLKHIPILSEALYGIQHQNRKSVTTKINSRFETLAHEPLP